MTIIGKIEEEITEYLTGSVEISEGVHFSQYNLVRRILLFENKTYPTGKTDKQGRYKYWYDIIAPRRDSEVKNLQVDSKNFLIYSDSPQKDFSAVFIANAALREWMWEKGHAEELNSDVEQFSGRGNVIFKKMKGGYETLDPANTYIINQAAKTIEDTPVIERHQLTQSQLRAKVGVWNHVEDVIEHCDNRTYSASERSIKKNTTSPYYEIFERNGEISEKELFEAQDKEGGDETKYILAKVIVAGLKQGAKDHKYILFADEISKMPYKSAHRGPYKGRFWREGMYEILFDHQVRANEIGNQIARGLEWSSKTVFRSSDKVIAQNILTDLANGAIIQSVDLSQVLTKMQGFDQLIADWNRLMQDANQIANSYEVVTGESLPSGTPFRLGFMQNQNANKLFVFLRQKLTLVYKNMFREWLAPELIKHLKGEDIIRLTGDADFISRFRHLQAENWYVRNLIAIGPHTPEIRDTLIAQKVMELEREEPVIKNTAKKTWEGILPRLRLTITGENMELNENLQTLATVLQYEQDPMRRAYLLDRIYAVKGIPVPPPPNPALMTQGQSQPKSEAPSLVPETEAA